MWEIPFFDYERVPVLPPEDLKSSSNSSKKHEAAAKAAREEASRVKALASL